jgi:hypothetical protein
LAKRISIAPFIPYTYTTKIGSINVGLGEFGKKNKRRAYVVNNHLNNLYVLSNKAVGPGKNPKLLNVGPTSISEARVVVLDLGTVFPSLVSSLK